MARNKTYKITFRKKVVNQIGSEYVLPSDKLSEYIYSFCQESWIEILDIKINEPAKKSYIKVKCTEKLYKLLLSHLQSSNIKNWIDIIN